MNKIIFRNSSLVFALVWFCSFSLKAQNEETRLPSDILLVDRSDDNVFVPNDFIGDNFGLQQRPRSLDVDKIESNELLLMQPQNLTQGFKLYSLCLDLEKAGHTFLDAKVLATFWKNKEMIPESWKQKQDGEEIHIFFMGTMLDNEACDKAALYIYWHNGWYWDFAWYEKDWGKNARLACITN